MSYRSVYDAQLGSNADLPQRISLAICKFAQTVQLESAATNGHVARAAYATKVINNPDQYARAWAMGVAAQQPADFTDATLDTQVAALWNVFAGVG